MTEKTPGKNWWFVDKRTDKINMAGFENSMEQLQREKQQRWHEIEVKVGRIGDELGRGIDEHIKPAVVGLIANGFHTLQSCEGHEDRALPWPWIDVESGLATGLRAVSRYMELAERYRDRKTTPTEEAEFQEYIDEQTIENEKTHQQLLALLEEFYRLQTEERVNRLIIRKGPWNQGRIQPEGVSERGEPREIQQSMSLEEKRRNLALYRDETVRFALFLKNKFFSS